MKTGAYQMNQKGSTTLLTIMLCGSLTLLCSYSLLYARHQYLSNKSRAQTYLCMKDQLTKLYSYSETMRKINTAIKVAFRLSAIPKIKVLHQSLKAGQQIYHFSYMHKVMTKGPCHFTQRASFLYNLPYKSHARTVLKRNLDGSAKSRSEKKWKIVISNFTGQEKIKPSFFLEASLVFSKQHLKLSSTQEHVVAGRSLSQVFSSLASWQQLLQRR